MRAYIAVAGALLLTACYHGPSLYTFDPVRGPTGVDADLRLKKQRVSGELIEVQDSDLIVLTDSKRCVSVTLRAMRAGLFVTLGTLLIERGGARSAMLNLQSAGSFSCW